MIAIVDYGMGNLRNVERALAALGREAAVTDRGDVISAAPAVILPGVGAFGEAVKRIDGLGLREPILEAAASGRPLLGICLGMQLLYEASEESPGYRGLGVLQGMVQKFAEGLKVPHIGWNDVRAGRSSRVLGPAGESGCFYFVHSYYAPVGELTVGETEYGTRFSAAVEQGNVFGVQFHPEKSQDAGMTILKRFTELV